MDTQKIRDIEAFDLRERILKDIRRTAETVEVRNRDRIRRKYGTGTKEAAEAWHNCRMSAAVMLVDRWGIRFEKEICEVLKVDPAELNDYLSDEEVAACVDLEGEGQQDTELEEIPEEILEQLQLEALFRVRNGLANIEHMIEQGRNVGPYLDDLRRIIDAVIDLDGKGVEGLKKALYKPVNKSWVLKVANTRDTQTGAAGAGSNAELKRRLDEIEDRIMSLQQITGAWGMDRAERDALAEGDMPTIAGLCDVGTENVVHIDKRLDELEDSIHAIGTQVEAIWLHTGAVTLDDEGQAEK